jgi:uncharacterized protein
MQLDAKHERMRTDLRAMKRVIVAFSAGVDSTLVLKVAADVLGVENVLAATSDSPSVPRAELEHARAIAESLGVEHVVVRTDEFDKPEYLANPTDRCYFCKDTLYDHLDALRAARGFDTVVNGINADDLGDHRPGITAAREHGITAPAADAGMTKDDVRALSALLNLPTFDKPASPCLSSRVPYGEPITTEKLRMIEAGEAFLHEIGLRECRVRHHDTLARIEVPPEWIAQLAQPDLAERIAAAFREIGYQYVTLDLRGFRSGSLNEFIPLESLRTIAD